MPIVEIRRFWDLKEYRWEQVQKGLKLKSVRKRDTLDFPWTAENVLGEDADPVFYDTEVWKLTLTETQEDQLRQLSNKGIWVFKFYDTVRIHPRRVFQLLAADMRRLIDREIKGD